ncbi:MAG: hypothetical protein AAGI24_01035 [Pseudomonadota bacterium]
MASRVMGDHRAIAYCGDVHIDEGFTMPDSLHSLLHLIDIALLVIIASTPVFLGAMKKVLIDAWGLVFKGREATKDLAPVVCTNDA